MKQKRILIPDGAKDDILKELHVDNQGIARTKSIAREMFIGPILTKT